MNPVVIAIIVAALILVVAMFLGLVCSLTSEPQPQRHLVLDAVKLLDEFGSES